MGFVVILWVVSGWLAVIHKTPRDLANRGRPCS